MTRKELEIVKGILTKIKNQDPFVAEAIAYLDKDIALREQQRKNQRDIQYGDNDYRYLL